MIWRNGLLPPGSPAFGATLTSDLLDHGYLMLGIALRGRDLGIAGTDLDRGLRIAAESIESAVRKGNPTDPERGFHLVVAAAAFPGWTSVQRLAHTVCGGIVVAGPGFRMPVPRAGVRRHQGDSHQQKQRPTAQATLA